MNRNNKVAGIFLPYWEEVKNCAEYEYPKNILIKGKAVPGLADFEYAAFGIYYTTGISIVTIPPPVDSEFAIISDP